MEPALKRIHIEPTTSVADVLREADHAPVLLEQDGLLYRLEAAPSNGIWADYEPEAVLRAIEHSAGAFSGLDVTQLKRDILEQRGQDSPGRPG